ncbi:hypothetical protein D3C84_391400 [compost metagenome]
MQDVGEARRGLLQLGEGPGGAATVAALPVQGHTPGVGVTVAAFDAGVQAIGMPGQGAGQRLVEVEALGGGEVIAHMGPPACCCVECRE